MNNDSQIDNVLKQFSDALRLALDQINYPRSPERIAKLMELLSLSKPQVYRITSGKTAPTLDALVKLRELDISIDDILDKLKSASNPDTGNTLRKGQWVDGLIDISGVVQHCLLTLTPLSKNLPVFATIDEDHFWHAATAINAAMVPDHAMSVDKIQMLSNQPTLAIVEDNPGTLTALCKQMESLFRVSAFSEGNALLSSARPNQFDCYLLDWRLPDISGEKLVTSIRQISAAPIFIVTGVRSSNDIAKMVSSANVRYVVKPVDEVILAAEMLNAISMRSDTQKLPG